MKHNKISTPDMETIERYWGSLEAYNKEQHDMGLIDLENGSYQDSYTGPTLRWDFSSRRGKKRDQLSGAEQKGRSSRFFDRPTA